ncbi:Dipeptide transporter dppD-like protein [Pseudomonas syringae pv. helianthi]|uniref:ABC-type dipeptide transporter n=2 Tax=Pseudomonas syringae group genomosp. 7 TaxID=251699 RepID=A0A0P9RLS9_9PSED|nr:Dipeptide transporter dppD-like protein [Pseudomonas syringae pv. helianthi]KPY86832.1 Dipeptide transporter dppD-like protein [Pseudomonas syringae pv. tagetis]RMR05397.1 Dipeptide transporter dppD-like protein [Pseudomonas syringae pv. helianthi]RMV51728.1 Dipeptide transporter dppD-like protein [Pseudomonas syringae pv. helianthi]RMW11953.1 Dipeptide transporter dppD-like protein [Pseudomonas syringae pv. tagetis]
MADDHRRHQCAGLCRFQGLIEQQFDGGVNHFYRYTGNHGYSRGIGFGNSAGNNSGLGFEEALVLHTRLGRRERREKVLHMLEAVGLPDPLAIYDRYPHELSGGMGQRVMLAAMLINDRRLLIADEPTSALDSGLRDQILELILGLVEQRNMGLLLISHDLPLVARYCDRALVMYRGRIVDRCKAAGLATASNPYTQTLWRCQPSALSYGHALPTLDRSLMETLP